MTWRQERQSENNTTNRDRPQGRLTFKDGEEKGESAEMTWESPEKPGGIHGVRGAQRKATAKSEGKCFHRWSLFPALGRVESCFSGLEEEAIPEWG